MPSRERIVDRGTRRGTEMVRDLGRELRQARVEHGLSQDSVGQAVGLSDTEVGRIERGIIRTVSVIQWSRLLSVVGLELAARAYPAGSPIRDRASLQLLTRLRVEIPAQIGWQSEVPIGPAGDLRAWDAVLRVHGDRIGVEAETRLVDLQAVTRRIALKCRDSGIPKAILLLSATRTNRAALRAFEGSIRDAFPTPGREALYALRAGHLPGSSAVVLL
jgi:transcriptional regulator with XRE-family HTH domain